MGLTAPSGPTIWAEGRERIQADIIFLHGLRGHAEKTWSKGDICWPRDLLPKDLPHVRIISWGYDSSVLKPIKASSQASIFGHAENLLHDLSRIRDSWDAEIRPIIFVGHSLGGLVIKEALIRASEYHSNGQHPDLGAIHSCTKGVVFLGTPHRGSGKASIGEIVSNIAKIGLQRPNDKLIEVLAEDSQVLERQMKSFTSLSNTLPIACVAEELPTGIGMIVPPASATLQGHLVRTSSVPANHMDMCRFSTPEDIGYQRIKQHIANFVQQAVTKGELQFIKDLLGGLSYREMNDRENQIENAYARTFEWLLPTDDENRNERLGNEFLDWIKNEKSPLYWISGKAGSGKSTLMKSLFGNPTFRELVQQWAKPAKCSFIGFFFFDRGKSMLQKSRVGLLRSLLHQILGQYRELIPGLFPVKFKEWTLRDPTQPRYRFEWTWDELSKAFEAIIVDSDSNSKFCIFADGLDEYSIDTEARDDIDEEEDLAAEQSERRTAGHVEIAKLFLNVAKSPNVKLCVSSRPLLRFESAFKGLPYLKLQDLTEADISIYVNGKLAQDPRMLELTTWDPEHGEALVRTIVDRASGVFLWVKIVVDHLLEGLEDHDTLTELSKTVDSLPRELGGRKGLYMRMLQDMKPDYRTQAAKLFRMVQMTETPLSPLSLSFAEAEDAAAVASTPIQQLTRSEAQFKSKWMEGRLKSRCAGLLESQTLPPSRGKTMTQMPSLRVNRTDARSEHFVEPQAIVQFLHQTAKEFLDQDFVWDLVFNHPETVNFNGNMALLRIHIMKLKKIGLDGADTYSKLTRSWEVILDALRYAIKIETQTDLDFDEYEALLDDLDHTAAILFQDMDNHGDKSPRFSHFHWTMTEPTTEGGAVKESQHSDFLGLAVESDLALYVAAKLSQAQTRVSERQGRPLLNHALLSYSIQPSRVRGSDSRYNYIKPGYASLGVIETLLQHGADPNQGFGVWDSPWEDALAMADNPPSSRKTGIVKLLIEYGADPFVGILAHDQSHVRSALFQINCMFEDQPALVEGLIAALKARGGRYFEGEEAELEYRQNVFGTVRAITRNSNYQDEVWRGSMILGKLTKRTNELGNLRHDPLAHSTYRLPRYSFSRFESSGAPSLVRRDLAFAHRLVHGGKPRAITRPGTILEEIQFHIRRLEDFEKYGPEASQHYLEVVESIDLESLAKLRQRNNRETRRYDSFRLGRSYRPHRRPLIKSTQTEVSNDTQ